MIILGPVNIGNPNEISMNKLASIILKLTNSKSKIILMIYQRMICEKKTSNKLAKNELNWAVFRIRLVNTINVLKN